MLADIPIWVKAGFNCVAGICMIFQVRLANRCADYFRDLVVGHVTRPL